MLLMACAPHSDLKAFVSRATIKVFVARTHNFTSAETCSHLEQRRAVGLALPVPAPLAGQLLEGGDDQVEVPRQLVRRDAVARLPPAALAHHVHPQRTCISKSTSVWGDAGDAIQPDRRQTQAATPAAELAQHDGGPCTSVCAVHRADVTNHGLA